MMDTLLEEEELDEAAWVGDAAEVARLIAAGANVHAKSDMALRRASMEGHAAVVEVLLGAGADVGAEREEAIFLACRGGHRAVVELLLLANATLTGRLLVESSRHGHLALVERFLAAGLDPCNGVALIAASEEGHVAVVDRLIRAGAKVDTIDFAALCKACRFGHTDVVARLLRAGATRFRVEGDSPLWWASSRGRLDIVELLLAFGVDLAKDNGFALFEAAQMGHQHVVDRLLAAGANPLTSIRSLFTSQARGETVGCFKPCSGLLRADPQTYTNANDVLQYASAKGDLDAVDRALQAGADVNADNGMALRLACWTGQLEVVERLLLAGADVHVCHGNPIAQACGGGHVAVVDTLLAAGATVQTSRDAVSWASGAGHLVIVQRVLVDGALPMSDLRALQQSALAGAVFGGHLPVLDYLLDENFTIAPEDGMLLQSAIARGRSAVVQRLLRSGQVKVKGRFTLLYAQLAGNLEIAEALIQGGAHMHALSDGAVLKGLENGQVDVVERLLQAGYAGSISLWRAVRKTGLAPRLVVAVPRTSFGTLPPPIQVLWLRYHVWIKHSLRRSLQRARDRLDRPPREPLGTGAPTRDELILHLATAGRRFAREYWTEGLPIFFPGSDFGAVPPEFVFQGSERAAGSAT